MIVGIGELLWDVYPDGRKVAGGAPFNFAFHCHQLGHPSAIVSRVGNDDLGRELREEVRRLGLGDDYIQTDLEHPTGTVRVTLDANKVPTYTIAENVAWDFIEWNPELERLAATWSPWSGARSCDEVEAVCFGTLAQRSDVSRSTIACFLSEASHSLAIFDVNLRSKISDTLFELISKLFERVQWVKVNDHELGELIAGQYGDSIPYLKAKESGLRLLFGTEEGRTSVGIVTRGERSTAILEGPQTDWVPAVPADVVDTVGAGDAFTAAMVCLHLEGRSLRDCARFANHYAARVCEHQGATPKIDRAEVERAAFGSQ